MKKLISCLALFLAFCTVACSAPLPSRGNGALQQTATETETIQKSDIEKKTEEILVEGPHDPTGFATGFGKVVVNPNPGVGLGGFGNADERTSTHVTDDICISCVAVSDGEKKLLLFSLDSIGTTVTVWNYVSKQMEKEFGIPQDCILINSSHSHSAPAVNMTISNMTKYMQTFYQGAKKAATQAIADLDRSELKYGRTDTQDLSYIRRYIKKDTGEFVGNWPNTLDPAQYDHESYPDEEMLILYFDRVNQKDIVLCNWQCHVTNVGTRNGGQVSSDYVGAFRDYVSEQLGVHCAFFQGAAGSTIPFGKLKGEKTNGDYKKHGQAIGDVLIAAIPTLSTMENTKIETLTKQIQLTHNEKQKVNRGSETQTVSLCVFAIGDLAIATSPNEMDHRLGMYVKDHSPYTMTFMSAYTNGNYGYIPAESSFPNGGYEVDSCRYVPGTGEMMAEELVNMLNAVHSD
ncbi:MAG: hypothetical protein E7580_06370 [Ruminococcaceae bacterium]|nr:hypothetical protein [Oscillospiraceae bacterium]